MSARSTRGFSISIRTDLSSELREGESVAVNGVCLTVVRAQAGEWAAEIGPETAKVTSLGGLRRGSLVNLERAMRADGRFGGHFVLGHVDGAGTIQGIRPEADFSWVTVSYPDGLAPLLIHRGSVAVDGISLTVATLEAKTFDVQIVPFTWAHTNLRVARLGDRVNLECDMVGKYVLRAVQQYVVSGFGQTVESVGRTWKNMSAPLKIAKGRKKSGSPFARIEDAIDAFRAGEMIIVCDDEDRENEGDLTFAAEKVTPTAINFMAKHGRGLICMPMTARAARRARDSADGESEHRTARHRVLRDDRSEAFHEHGDFGGRSRQHGARGDRHQDEADAIWRGPATCFRCARSRAACWCARGRPRRPSTWRALRACIRPASSAKS